MSRRVGLAVLLLILLGALLVGFGNRFNGTAAYPDAAAIDADYADHVGERVHLWTVVVAVEDGRGESTGSDSAGRVVVATGELRLAVIGLDPSVVAVGDRVQVYGELRPDHRIDPVRTVVVPAERQRWLYAVSSFAVCLAASAFLRQWRIDLQSRSFVPRGED
ncbi:MAG: hypothetical protein ABEI99_03945 [Halobaculum sp.]